MTFTPVTQKDPTQSGALPAYETKCECGAIIRSAFLSSLNADVGAHEAWHQRKDRRR